MHSRRERSTHISPSAAAVIDAPNADKLETRLANIERLLMSLCAQPRAGGMLALSSTRGDEDEEEIEYCL